MFFGLLFKGYLYPTRSESINKIPFLLMRKTTLLTVADQDLRFTERLSCQMIQNGELYFLVFCFLKYTSYVSNVN